MSASAVTGNRSSSSRTSKIATREILGQRSWVLRTRSMEVAVTEAGGHMAPVTFGADTPRPFAPYHVSPWQGAASGIPESGSERMLRGDFFCMPFGGGPALKNEVHPPHGSTSTKEWRFISAQFEAGSAALTIAMPTAVRKGKVTRTLLLREGHDAIYSLTAIEGFAGPTTLGHHAVLALPQTEGAMLISTSSLAFGMTFPAPFGSPARGEYQSLAINKTFRSLGRVPSIFRETKPVDCSSFPRRQGFTDLLQIAQRPNSKDPAWVTAVNTDENYLWFALKDTRVLPSTIFWIENRGRHQPPWSGRNCSLGLEDVCTYFDSGIAASHRANAFSERGIRTTHTFREHTPFRVPYIQGAVRIPRGYGRVRSAVFADGTVTFIDAAGKKAHCIVDHAWLRSAAQPDTTR